MYVPASFSETDPDKLRAFIDQFSFATLISQDGIDLVASHLPLLLDRNRGDHGTLTGHMARANSQWRTAAGQRVLVIFQGPHAYISPAWYESLNVVPTWNYVAVHVYGTLRLIDDRDRLLDLIRRTVERYESTRPNPWLLASQSEEYISQMLQAIVGFEVEIERIEGKWKLSQNHGSDRRSRVIGALLASADPDAQAIAELMIQR